VVAENIVARSPASLPAAPFSTKKAAPHRPPAHLQVRTLQLLIEQVEPSGPTSLLLSWTPLLSTEWNAANAAYQIQYRPMHRGSVDEPPKDATQHGTWVGVSNKVVGSS